MIFCLTLLKIGALFEKNGTNSSKSGILNFEKTQRQRKIPELFESLEKSSPAVEDCFDSHRTPISLPQYCRLKKRYAQHGVAEIEDRRQAGNARKIAPQKVELLCGVLPAIAISLPRL